MQHPKPRSSLARLDSAQPRLRRRTILSLAGALCAASPVALGLAGCGTPAAEVAVDNPLAAGGTFIAIPRPTDGAAISARRGALKVAGADVTEVGVGDDFLLAVRKDDLLKGKWFLSAFIKQFYPGGVQVAAAQSLGMRVVRFVQQNNRLYVIDGSDNNTTSTYYDPTVLVEAYPIINDYAPFQRMPGSSDYLLIDPSAGLNKFGSLSDAYAGGTQPSHFNIELSFMQRFRKLDDGATYEQVFTGYLEQGDASAYGQGETQPYRLSGVLGLSLRQYAEGEGFKPTEFVDRNDKTGQTGIPEWYFRGDTFKIPNSGLTDEYAVHFNARPGKPITFVVSANVDKVQNRTVLQKDKNGKYQPTKVFADFDVYGAIAKGVTNWNDVFGFEAFKVRKGTAADSPGDDDTNFIYVDEDESFGAAFANWRQNPNTGEIRGASVYFNTIWLSSYLNDPDWADDARAPQGPQDPRTGVLADVTPADLHNLAKVKELRQKLYAEQRAARPKVPKLLWEPLRRQAEPLCTLWAPGQRGLTGLSRPFRFNPKDSQLTRKQKIEQFVTHVVLHEVGHTLGLRHNFKGSLKYGPGPNDPKSSSVMEYILDPDAVSASTPQSYDRAAVRYLYQLEDKLPTDKFCTDENVSQDPDCTPYDQTANPLVDYYAPYYIEDLKNYLETGDFLSLLFLYFGEGDPIYEYIQAGTTAAQRLQAFNIFWGDAKLPVPAAKEQQFPGFTARTGDIMYLVLPYLLDPGSANARFTNPVNDPALVPIIVEQTRLNLLVYDGSRDYDLKRFLVDALKRLQRSDALSALVQFRTDLAGRIPGLTGADKANSQDLLNRVNKALSPYFNN